MTEASNEKLKKSQENVGPDDDAVWPDTYGIDAPGVCAAGSNSRLVRPMGGTECRDGPGNEAGHPEDGTRHESFVSGLREIGAEGPARRETARQEVHEQTNRVVSSRINDFDLRLLHCHQAVHSRHM